MYKLAFIFTILALANAKTVKKDHLDDDIDLSDSINKQSNTGNVCFSDPSKTLWVLDVNDDAINFKRLRSANKMDRRVYAEAMEPAIKNFQRHQNGKKKLNDNPKSNSNMAPEKHTNTEETTKYDMKKAVKLMINKLIMSYERDPNVNLHPGDNNKVSLKLYFKGPYSSLVVRYKNQRWSYFLQPPSPLPHWFYEEHTKVTRSGKAMYVEIPESVRKEFYGKFFHLLQSYIGFTAL